MIFIVSDILFRYDKLGLYYTGSFNQMIDDGTCKPWTDSKLQRLYTFKAENFADGFVPESVCRYPNNSQIVQQNIKEPWCFNDKFQPKKCGISVDGKYCILYV